MRVVLADFERNLFVNDLPFIDILAQISKFGSDGGYFEFLQDPVINISSNFLAQDLLRVTVIL